MLGFAARPRRRLTADQYAEVLRLYKRLGYTKTTMRAVTVAEFGVTPAFLDQESAAVLIERLSGRVVEATIPSAADADVVQPGTEFDDRLHLSVSQVKAYLRCPRQFYLKYVRGERPEFVPAAMAFGRAFHGALERFYRVLGNTGEELPVEDLVATFEQLWRQKLQGPIPVRMDEGDSPSDPVALASRMLAVFHEYAATDAVDVIAVEQPFSVPLVAPDSGEVQEEKLVGVIDLLAARDGTPLVVEHKTAARRYIEDVLRFDFQPTVYRMAIRSAGLGPVGLRFQVVTKTKSPTVQIEDVSRTDADERDFLRLAVGVLRAIDGGLFYPLRGWQCRGCPFQAECSSLSGTTAVLPERSGSSADLRE